MFYKKKIKERTIEQLEQELADAKTENQKLIEQNNILRTASHKINNRIRTLEYTVNNFNAAIFNTEISEELTVTLDDIKRLKQDYESDISKIKKESLLPSTKIKGLDDMFRYFSREYSANNIHFNLKVNGSIPYLTENIIEQSKLENMIGDHLQDALTAVNESDNTFRNVLAIIGLSGSFYEFTVFDSGIPFAADTLSRLGTECITTHKDTGGSGVGFMTTFETMRLCGASLIISENSPSECNYTKSVTVRFDGENRYIIETYRSEDIIKNDGKYTVISIS